MHQTSVPFFKKMLQPLKTFEMYLYQILNAPYHFRFINQIYLSQKSKPKICSIYAKIYIAILKVFLKPSKYFLLKYLHYNLV